MTTLGDLIEIDERTVLVLGQELRVERDQPDVANSLVHRVGDTLVMVDTGVTSVYRAALREAADRVGPWSRALVLTTHGHPDHVGNNDLADELGVPVEHYVPARDLDQMRDPGPYWIRSFECIAGLPPLPVPPALAGNKVVSLFQPMRPFGATTRTYEERPLERIRIGSLRFTGWTFADGAVRVLRSQGHCAGHVIVHLRDCGVLHLSDEGNGPCGAMCDADQLKIQTVLGAVSLFEEEEATLLTDGHTFALRRGADVVSYLDGLLEQATALQAAALKLTGESRQVRPSEFTARYAETIADPGVGGANPNAMFTAMMAVNQLRELGLRPESGAVDAPWSRPTLHNPDPTGPGPG